METLLRLPDVCARIGLKKTAVYVRVKTGEFPQPVRIGIRAIAWRASDIQKWIDQRAARGAA